MSRIKLPHCRKFPERISEEKLKELVTKEMEKKGGNNYYQAWYYQESAAVAVNSNNPLLANIQPNPKKDDLTEGWFHAYQFVRLFLEEHKMKQTLKTIETELGALPQLDDTFKSINYNEFFKGLIPYTKQKKSIQERVKEFQLE